MEVVKESGGNKILKKKSGRFAVQDKDGKWINGLDKTKILLEAGLIKTGLPQSKEAEAAAEAPAPAPTPEGEDAAAADEKAE